MKRTGFKPRKTSLKRTGSLSRTSVLKRSTKAPKRRKSRLAKQSKKPVAKLKRELWEITRQIIFKRHGTDCYTCGAKDLKKSNLHCGHFITDAVCSMELSYSLDNLRPQCFSCNIWKSGNWPRFEARLIEENGADFPALLKKRNQETSGKKYDSLWFQAKIAEYSSILLSPILPHQ